VIYKNDSDFLKAQEAVLRLIETKYMNKISLKHDYIQHLDKEVFQYSFYYF
jgi:hypothetical protein